MFPGVRPEIFAVVICSGLNVVLISPGLEVTMYEVTLAPPSSVGAPMFSVAVPNSPIATELMDGAVEGPKGLCQKADI